MPTAAKPDKSVKGKPVPATSPKENQPALRGNRPATWPAAAVAELDLTPAASGQAAASAPAGGGKAKAGKTPLSIGLAAAPASQAQAASAAPAGGKVRVEVLDRKAADKAQIPGVLWKVTGAPGSLDADFDYSAFRDAYGADWASRLQIFRLPDCALSTPERAECKPAPVATRNDQAVGKLSATLEFATAPQKAAGSGQAAPAGSGAMFAAAAGPSGPSGSFSATSLSPSATWSSGNPTGDFSWSYPLRVPPGLGGPVPQIALGYSSSAVDGRTVATNNQPSQLGEGFDFHPGFIERRYKPCADDKGGNQGTAQTGDQCWATDNATMSLNGRGGELVLDDATGAWKLRSDDGSKIERLSGVTNGDDNGEHWKVTTSDGNQYYFGLNRLPGWAAGKQETNSAWTTPVFGNNSGEPCYGATFASSWCDQAYRWQLDYVVDPHGNVMSYYYQKETNFYALNLTAGSPKPYTRGGWLDRIDYGQRDGSVYSTVPVGRVVFEMAERCLPGSTCDWSHPENYPDTPLDQKCDGGNCQGKWSPVFFTTKRIAKVRTQVSDGANLTDVDSWTLRHEFPAPGDGTRAGMWLEAIQQTGHVGTAVSLPEVNFDWVQLSNRVMKPLDTQAPMNWMRIKSIHSESGSTLTVDYSGPECSHTGTMPASPAANTMRCMPAAVPKPGTDTVDYDWFHKYVVTRILENDNTGGSPAVQTTYDYLDGAAWRHDDADGLVDPKYKTWSQWRGYGKVRTTKGQAGTAQQVTERRFFRGMNGDKLADGSLRSAAIDGITDHDQFAGQPREEKTFLGLGGPVLSSSLTTPWRGPVTATRVKTWGTAEARRGDTERTRTSSAISGGRQRETEVIRTFDPATGQLIDVSDLGDLAVAGDESCTRTTLLRNTTLNILTLPSRQEKVSVACDKPVSRPADVLSDVRTSYDGQAWGAVPTKGTATRVEQLIGYVNGQPQYKEMSRSVVDSYGRGIESYDAKGEKTTTTYTPATGGPVTKVDTTNPLGHKTSMTLIPAWGSAAAQTDANNKTGTLEYDGLGRLLRAWTPDRPKNLFAQASTEFTYQVRTDGPVVTTTKALKPNGNYVTTYELYDGLLRPRQTQIPGPTGGRIVTETRYNSLGQPYKKAGATHNTDAPGNALVTFADNEIPGMNVTEFDAAGRATADIFYVNGVEKHRTKTEYDGDLTHVTPPTGSAGTTVKNAQGQTTEIRQYHSGSRTSSYDATKYAYNKAGALSSVTDVAGNAWTYEYDLRGRLIKTVDPDKGPTEMTYNDAGELTSTKDARGIVLAYGYDKLGRKTGVFENTTAGKKRSEWWYDKAGALGLQWASGQYDAAGNGYYSMIDKFDSAYRPLELNISIPANETGLSGNYGYSFTYKVDGSPESIAYPSRGGLPGEVVSTSYTNLGAPRRTAGLGSYVAETYYTKYGEVERLDLDYDGTETNDRRPVFKTFHYEEGSRRLIRSITERTIGAPYRVSDVNYTYAPGGAVTKVVNNAEGLTADTQCFSYDHHDRITEAWTPTSGDCGTTRSASSLNGPAPYWHSWTYDKIGNRLSETQHKTTGDLTRNYGYKENGVTKPHTVTSLSSTLGRREWTYDATGNTLTRLGPSGTGQALAWDAEGRLSKVTEGSQVTEFLYDASGSRLIRKEAGGAKTLYLPGMEVRSDGKASRYYSHGGEVVAVRTTDAGLTWLSSDRNGSSDVTIAENGQAISRRYLTPFGTERGTIPSSWVDDKGYVGGTKDRTGLTHLGAREYDPFIGRFISADPIMDPLDPQQMHGYAYANNNPVTLSDPTGMLREEIEAGGGGCDAACGAAAQSEGEQFYQEHQAATARKEYEDAKKTAETPILDVVLKAGGEILMEVLGINDIRDCITKGDVMACVSTVANIIPWGKIFKLPKIAKAFERAYEAFKAFGEKLAKAKAVLRRGEVPAGAAAKKADNAAATGGKAADDTAAASTKADDTGEAMAGSGKCHSFAPATEVAMADGSQKPISNVEIGDEVVATDPVTGETGPKAVTALHVNQDTDLTELTVTKNDGTNETLSTTQHHPFWDATLGTWVNAGELQAGHELRTLDGSTVHVTLVANHTGSKQMRDLTVGDVHTYYVVTGTTPVLVHNCDNEVQDGTGRSDTELLDMANGMRDEFAASVRQTKNPPAVVTAGYNVETKQVAVGASHGGGACAEVCVINQLGGDASKIRFTMAVRPRNGRLINICFSCSATSPKSAFPPGTVFDSDVIASLYN
ncbi:polymorphic toxin-type HINT domain-containing protein [Longispora albida]|uniref:polymorphic toxin-type HINT domain-containing protein n=1 Tax=Longispora albida TaxID=203523 RepID=UPI0003770EC0|nr:polymorphic toxin-type HINT domain-containing protein [Longispora albida]